MKPQFLERSISHHCIFLNIWAVPNKHMKENTRGNQENQTGVGLMDTSMVGLLKLRENWENAMTISELAARHPGGQVRQKSFEINLHQERGWDRDGAASE